jgi:hypothetical protein
MACEKREEDLGLDTRPIGENDGSRAKFNHGRSGALTVLSDRDMQTIDLHSAMTKDGYRTIDNQVIEHDFNDMEIRAFREPVLNALRQFHIRTLLDCGCGGSGDVSLWYDWSLSATEYFERESAYRFETTRGLDQSRRWNQAQKRASWEIPVI